MVCVLWRGGVIGLERTKIWYREINLKEYSLKNDRKSFPAECCVGVCVCVWACVCVCGRMCKEYSMDSFSA